MIWLGWAQPPTISYSILDDELLLQVSNPTNFSQSPQLQHYERVAQESASKCFSMLEHPVLVASEMNNFRIAMLQCKSSASKIFLSLFIMCSMMITILLAVAGVSTLIPKWFQDRLIPSSTSDEIEARDKVVEEALDNLVENETSTITGLFGDANDVITSGDSMISLRFTPAPAPVCRPLNIATTLSPQELNAINLLRTTEPPIISSLPNGQLILNPGPVVGLLSDFSALQQKHDILLKGIQQIKRMSSSKDSRNYIKQYLADTKPRPTFSPSLPSQPSH